MSPRARRLRRQRRKARHAFVFGAFDEFGNFMSGRGYRLGWVAWRVPEPGFRPLGRGRTFVELARRFPGANIFRTNYYQAASDFGLSHRRLYREPRGDDD